MQTIHKYDIEDALSAGSSLQLRLPKGSRVLKAADQKGHIHIWALVDTDGDNVPYSFVIVGTGWKLPSDFQLKHAIYLDTVFRDGFVWHVFYSF